MGDVHKITAAKSYIFVIAGVAALNNCNLGYDIGIVAGVGPLLLRQTAIEMNEVRLELFIGALDIASLLGAFSSNFIADKFGRKGCMALSEILFIASVLGMACATSFTVLMLFRCLCGVAVGLGLTIGPLYIGELAPDELRGKLVSWSELATNIGLLAAFSAGFCFSGLDPDVSWRVMLGVGGVLPSLLLICLCFMPESPRWLVVNNRELEAQQVLQRIHPDGTDVVAMTEGIQLAIEAEQDEYQNGGWYAILYPTSPVMYALFATLGIAVIQQLSGIEALTSYFMFIFDEAGVAGDDQYVYLILFGLCKLITVYFAAKYFDNPKVGRRPLLLLSGVGVTAAMLVFLVLFSGPVSDLSRTISVCNMFWYVIAYSVGYGPGAWVVMLEVLPMQIRAKGLSLATLANRLVATAMSSSFLSAVEVLSYQGYFLVLSLLGVCCVLYVYFLIPETQGRSLEEMSDVFSESYSVRRGGQGTYGGLGEDGGDYDPDFEKLAPGGGAGVSGGSLSAVTSSSPLWSSAANGATGGATALISGRGAELSGARGGAAAAALHGARGSSATTQMPHHAQHQQQTRVQGGIAASHGGGATAASSHLQHPSVGARSSAASTAMFQYQRVDTSQQRSRSSSGADGSAVAAPVSAAAPGDKSSRVKGMI